MNIIFISWMVGVWIVAFWVGYYTCKKQQKIKNETFDEIIKRLMNELHGKK